MAYRTKVQALNDICLQLGGGGGHTRTVQALNEWARLLGGIGGHTRNLFALNEISLLLGGAGGHTRELRALNEISGLLGGEGGHVRNLAALTEAAAQAPGEPEEPQGPEPVPVYVVGDSNADPVYSPGSWVARTLARLDGRFFAPPGANLAAAGKATDFAVRQLPFLAALTEAWGPGVVWYLHGFNPSAGAAGEARAFVDAAKALGHKVMWLMPGAWTVAGDVQFPPAIGAYAGDPAVRVIRTDLLLANSGPNLEGTGKGDTEDGTHFNESGNLVVRDALLSAMAEVFGVEDVGYRDVYPVTAVAMTGSGGAVMAPASGQVPDGWQGWHPYSGDGTVEFACVSEGGRDAVEIRITGNSTATTAWLQLPSATGLPFAYQAGDFIDGTFSGRQVSGRLNRFEITTFPSRLEAAGDLSETLGAGVWRSPGYNLPKTTAGSKLGIVVAVVAPAGQSVTVRVWDVAVWRRAVPEFAPVADRGSVPTIGNPAVGAACVLSVGTWFGRPGPVTLACQWLIDGAAIPGATGGTYTPLPAQEGRLLACRVTASNGAGATSWTSDARTVRAAAATPPVLTGTPEVTGGGVVGAVHGVTGFAVSGTPAPALGHAWWVDGVAVGSAATYTSVAGDAGGALVCEVSATNSAGTTSAISAPVTVLAPAGSGLRAETEACLARIAALSGPAMAPGQAAALDAFYGAAVGSGWWAKVKRLYVGGLHCPEAAGIDLVDRVTTLVHSGAAAPCDWSAALGWTGKDNARLDLRASPKDVTGQNSVALFVWYTDLTPTLNEAGYDLNNAGGGNTVRFQQQVSSGGVISSRLHSSVNQGTVASIEPGFKCASRTAANLISYYGQDGGLIATDGKASTAPVAGALYMWNQSGINNRRSVAAFGIAEGLDAAEVQGLRDALAALGEAFWLAV